jgi:hypothetical protein
MLLLIEALYKGLKEDRPRTLLQSAGPLFHPALVNIVFLMRLQKLLDRRHRFVLFPLLSW